MDIIFIIYSCFSCCCCCASRAHSEVESFGQVDDGGSDSSVAFIQGAGTQFAPSSQLLLSCVHISGIITNLIVCNDVFLLLLL